MSDQHTARGFGPPVTRRAAVTMGLAIAGGTLTAGPARPAYASSPRQASPVASSPGDHAETIIALAGEGLETQHLNAVIVRVTIDGQEVVTAALGESMTGVPATTDMHFRNGAVAISYMSTLLLRLVDQKALALDDPLATWLPDLPDADRVTLRMLANMTAGYPDFVQNAEFQRAFYADPFRQWTTEERLAIAFSTPSLFAPGANWGYAHTNYLLLGQVLEMVGDKPLDVLLQEQVLAPMGLRNTVAWPTPEIPAPVLHAFSSERKETLGIPAGTRFYEESSFWNPSWSLAQGSIQTTDIVDMTTTAEAVGEGTLLSPESHQEQIAPKLLGFGVPLAGCAACRTLNRDYGYGLGVVLSGAWILQNPLFGGYGAIAASLPARRIAIAVATTFGEESFDDQGNPRAGRASWEIFAAIGALLAPEDAPAATRR
ncbi:MAG: serine hydrolase domain-containing protein [Thermomicrobiales bacterium]